MVYCQKTLGVMDLYFCKRILLHPLSHIGWVPTGHTSSFPYDSQRIPKLVFKKEHLNLESSTKTVFFSFPFFSFFLFLSFLFSSSFDSFYLSITFISLHIPSLPPLYSFFHSPYIFTVFMLTLFIISMQTYCTQKNRELKGFKLKNISGKKSTL